MQSNKLSHFISSNSFQLLALDYLGRMVCFWRNWDAYKLVYVVIILQNSSSRKISKKSIISAFSGLPTFNLSWLVKRGISGWWSLCFHFVSKYCSFWVLLSSIFSSDELLPPLERISLLLPPLVRTPNKNSYY